MGSSATSWRPTALVAARMLAVVAFGGYFAILAAGDLAPLEQLGAGFSGFANSVVRDLTQGGPADRAGLEVGDRILAVDGRRVVNALDWASVFAGIEEGRPVPFTIDRAGVVTTLEVRFAKRPTAPWTTTQGIVVLLGRLVQLVTLLFAIAIVRRADRAEAWLGFWLLATIAIYSVGLPPRMAVVWRQLPLVLEVLFYLPSVSKALIGFILFAFFRVLLGRPLRDAATGSWPFLLSPVPRGTSRSSSHCCTSRRG
ncbi:MAG: PDZ domain-containing protein [Acidobacteriota bacterium]